MEGGAGGRKQLKAYMARKRLTWTNLTAGSQWYGPPMEGYDVSFLPFNLVLDRDGRIAALDPRAEELGREVVRALGKGAVSSAPP